MARRMSVFMTIDAVEAEIKTVTRRHEDTWIDLKAGDPLTLIEKGQGLAKGEKQRIIKEAEVTDVDVIPLYPLGMDEVRLEGLWDRACREIVGTDLTPTLWFAQFWMAGHGYKATDDPRRVRCRRIEWRYLKDGAR